MRQRTVRVPDELLDRVRHAAKKGGRSIDEFVGVVLDAATNPDLAGSEADALRERLAWSDLLAPAGSSRMRPPAAVAAMARIAAGSGTPLSDIVCADR